MKSIAMYFSVQAVMVVDRFLPVRVCVTAEAPQFHTSAQSPIYINIRLYSHLERNVIMP